MVNVIRQTFDEGQLSIDFIVGFTIFMIAFIMVMTLLSGLLIGLQNKHIDYDAVAYRTGVILAEDQGYGLDPVSNTSTTSWENIPDVDKDQIYRFGLEISKDAPGVLSNQKIDRFFNDTSYSLDDFHKKVIFDENPALSSSSPIYHFNVTITPLDVNLTSYKPVGEEIPSSSSTGYIHRVVKIRQPTVISFSSPAVPNVTGASNQIFTYFDFPNLYLNPDPVYTADPFSENTTIILSNLAFSLNGSTSLTGLKLYIDSNPRLQSPGTDTPITDGPVQS